MGRARAGPTLAGLREQDVEINGVRLHVVECGPRDGPPLILLHGFPEFWYGWRRQLQPLASAGYRVIVPDQRGYNRSAKPRRVSAYRLDTLAEDVRHLVRWSGHARASLVGHDWGGLVAWWTALRFPPAVHRLAVLNAPHPQVFRRQLLHDRRQRRKSWYVFFFQLPWLPERWYRRNDWEIGERSLRGTATPAAFSDDDLAAYRRAWSRPGAMRSMIHWYRAALRCRRQRVESLRVTVPTAILWGARDRFLDRRLAEASLELCDDGRLMLFPEATHWIQHDEPERVNRALLEFLAAPAAAPDP